MRSNLKLGLNRESFTEAEGIIHARPPSLISRKADLWPDFHSACGDISAKAMQQLNGTTGSNRSWEAGEESPVSVIGHAARWSSNNNNINPACSQPSSGSTSIEHPPSMQNGFSPHDHLHPRPRPHQPAGVATINSSSASCTAGPNCPSSNQHSHLVFIPNYEDPRNLNSAESASNYAELLSERVQQAFRKSHELQTPLVKTWPNISATSKRMEWLNLPEEPPFINAGRELSKVFHTLKRHSSTAAAGSTNVTHVDDAQACSSDEDGQALSMSTYSCSSRKDHQEDEEDSVIDFFPAATSRAGSAVNSQTQRGSKGRCYESKRRAEECNILNGATTQAGPAPLMTMVQGRSSCSTAAARAGGAGAGQLVQLPHHVDESEGSRVSTSYKWDDAERWLTASPCTTTSTSGRSAPGGLLLQYAGGELHNRDGPVKAALYPQLVQVHTRKPLSDSTSTQDKHVAEGRSAADHMSGSQHGARREAVTESEKERKRDMATQSTPAEWSSCDSPEELEEDEEGAAMLTLSSATDHRVGFKLGAPMSCSTAPDIKEARPTQMKTSPPRHNTPARRSVSCNRQKGSRYSPDSCGQLSSSTSGKLLNLRELESCHLDKLKLARDIPLGTSSTWQLFAEDETDTGFEKLLERRSPPPPPPPAPPPLFDLYTSSICSQQQQNYHQRQYMKVNMLETRVSAWEDVERAKHLAKVKRDEAKIEAWESLQRAEADAELQKLEVKLEKMRFEGREKIMGKLGAAQKRALEMRRVVEAQKVEQLARVAMRANHIRKSGHFPTSAFNVMCNLTTKIKPSSNLSFS